MVCEMSHDALVHWSIPEAWQFSLGLNECLTFAVDEQAGWGWRPVKRKWPVPSPADPVIGGDGAGSLVCPTIKAFTAQVSLLKRISNAAGSQRN